MTQDLQVYTKPGCPFCMNLTGLLQNEGYEFTEIDILSNEAAFEEMKELSGQGLAPTVRIGEQVLADCRVPDLQRVLSGVES